MEALKEEDAFLAGPTARFSKAIATSANVVQSDQAKQTILQQSSSSRPRSSTSTVAASHCGNYFYGVPNVSSNFVLGPDAVGLDLDIDGPTFQYDFDFDLKLLKKVLKNTDNLDESGYHSVVTRSQHSHFGTGWSMLDGGSVDSLNSVDDWGKSL